MGILLLHGLGGDRRQPLSLVSPVLPAGVRIAAPDIRAHGTSTEIGEPQEFAFERLTAELVETVRAEGLDREPLTIVGVSMGAALGLRLALEAATSGAVELRRLVFLRPAFSDVPLPPNLAAFPVMGELLHRHPADRAEALFRQTGPYARLAAASPLGATAAIDQFRKPDARARAVRLVEIPRNRAFASARELAPLVRLGVPTAVIAAQGDPVHPLSVAGLWHSSLAGSTMTVLPARDDGLATYTAASRAAVAAALA